MDYIASAIGIAAFTVLMNLWVHMPAPALELTPAPVPQSMAWSAGL